MPTTIRKTGLFLFVLFVLTRPISVFAQDSLRVANAVRIHERIKIDGVLDEEAWKKAEIFNGKFYQMAPDNGAEASYNTRLYLAYDNKALYVAALMYDPEPNSIARELGDRDDFEINTDVFGVAFDPYKKGQNGFIYILTTAGVQGDALMTSRDMDDEWDAVWNSATSISDEGWIAELEIPYSAIRFPNQENQVWGLNFFRINKVLNEETSWNFIDRNIQGELNQFGELHGLADIKPPLRLSFLPYLSVGGEYASESSSFSRSIAGGMDMKLGISESFTLDMSLVPDFSQVQSDNQVLNLSPFEVRYDENRPFFTEGTELFNKGRIFYSRRIGQMRGDIPDDELTDNDSIVEYPITTQLINASKLSGRTASGTGLGFFNAITANTNAVIEKDTNYVDESGELVTNPRRHYLMEPLTNFNVVVIDQNLKNNSYVGLINTNVWREGDFRDANVTLGDFRFRDKTNTYSISGNGGLSQVFTVEDGERINTQGFKSRLSLSKVSGKLQYGATMNVMSDTWDINDLGFMRRNNQVEYSGRISYNIFKPVGIFNQLGGRLRVNYEQLYKPNTYVQTEFSGNFNAQFKNFTGVGMGFNLRPFDNYDYFEPREPGYFWRTELNYNFFVFYGTDSRKKLSAGIHTGMWNRPSTSSFVFFGGIGPAYRVSNRMNLWYELNFNLTRGGRGYVTRLYDTNDELTDIIFGHRDQNTFTNTIGIKYTFTNRMGLNFRLRHYWSWVEHSKFYDLTDTGDLTDSDYTGLDENGQPSHNTTFNAFTIDMVYSWQVAPGSFFTAVWKNQIYASEEFAQKNFFENLNNTFDAHGTNSLTLKLVYFIDIAYFRKKDI